MKTYEEGLELVLGNIKPIGRAKVDISNALGAFLYRDISSSLDLPVFSNSKMDGFAIRSEDTIGASENSPVVLKVVSTVKTGIKFSKRLKKGEAFGISTGSKMPYGADAVVIKEDVRQEGDLIIIPKEIKKGENIRFKGEDIKKGEIILKGGTKITPAIAGLLAATGIQDVFIYKIPEITFISSGSELVKEGQRLKAGQIYNSNYYMISALLKRMGINIKKHYIVKDEIGETISVLDKAIKDSDMVIISGGVSVGDVDFVKDALRLLRVRKIFWRLKIKPGKPSFFGKKGDVVIFGLPGNPVSSFVNTILFVIPALKKMMGANDCLNEEFEAVLESDLIKKEERKEFFRGKYTIKDGRFYVTPFTKQDSHILSSLALANCLIITDYGERHYKEGERVRILLI